MHIAVAGNIGSGKTTLTKLLAKHYGWSPRFEPVDNNPYLEDFYADVPVLKVHTGNRFEVRNASFEVLFTLEDLYPSTILNGGMNESSLLLKMNRPN